MTGFRSDGRGTERTLKTRGSVPRLALTKTEVAEALGSSVDSVERYVWPEVKLIGRGRLVFVPLRELEAWLDRNAERTIAA
jgi:hypothetical protein